MAELNITNIPAPRVPFVDERTGLMAREWYRFFLNLFVLTGSGNNPITLEELQLGPPNQPDLAELLIQINQNIAPQYEDQSGDFLATLDTAQLMSMMSRFENAEAAIQGAYLQPVVQTGTIANYNLDNSPTAGGIAYGTGPALAVSAAGTLGQVLTSGGAGAPTWATDGGGTVTTVSVVSANGLAGTVATATTTPAITLSTTVTGLLKGNGTAISAATSGTDYAPATSGTSILYGDGAGGFSNVTIGTGVAFAGGTLSATGSGGTVTSVAALTLGTTGTDLSSTVANGTTTPVITLQVPTASATNRGALSAADWTTFNNKGSGTVTSVTGTAPVVSSGGATPAISMAAATTSVNGYLTSTDWNTFNGKQPAGSYLVSGGALGTPSSGTVTNLTGTASININGTVGATTANTGAFTTLSATGITTVAAGSAALPAIVSTTGTADTGLWFPAADTIAFSTAGTERARIDSSGRLLVGATSSFGSTFSMYQYAGATYNGLGIVQSDNSSGGRFMLFAANSAQCGVIDRVGTTSAVVYTATSDRRLKENIVDAPSAIEHINAVKVRSYNWIDGGHQVKYGVIAQEFVDVEPDAVVQGDTGEAIEKTWSVDTSALVPAMIKAIQEQQAIITALTTRITALEAK